jgi:CheY-like chemotaxis protein
MSFLNAQQTNAAHKRKFQFRNRRRIVAQSDLLLNRKRCLVLEDEFLIALDIQQILEGAGAASVICQYDADDALVALRNGPRFDLAVLDIMVSGVPCTGVAAALAAQSTPFVFLTGVRSDDEYIRQFPDAPVVEKPFHVPRLLEALRRALAGPR